MGRSLKFKEEFSNSQVEKNLAPIKIDGALMEGFVRTFLWERFDAPKETPSFHINLWDLFTSEHPRVAVAAPRSHGKSTAGTLSFGLASALFGASRFVIVVGATEDLAVKQLGEIKTELTDNEDLKETFNIKGFSKDNEGEFICHTGTHSFKMMAKGAEQKLRGLKWSNKRPDLILIDDLEEDEAVMNQERRIKLRNWFMNALLPLGSDHCKIRMVGTILHLDSLLNRLLKNKTWHTALFKAHRAFDDFSEILWPEKFSEQRLRDLRDNFIHEGNASGYSQEYLNTPVATVDQYFRPSWFLPMEISDHGKPKRYYASIDLAISKKDHANKTSVSVGGLDNDNMLHIVYNEADKLDSKEIIDLMFKIHEIYEPEVFLVERGAIEKTLLPFLNEEMLKQGIYLNLEFYTPVTDKPSRARAFQARMKAGGVKFDKESEWWPELENEMLTFPRSASDDRVDSTTSIGFLLDKMQPADSAEELAEAELVYEEMMDGLMQGRSKTTGY